MKTPTLGLASSKPSLRLIDSVERLQAISRLEDGDWLDLLQLSWRDYFHFRLGQQKIPYKSLERLGQYFGLKPVDFYTNRIDFQKVAHSQVRVKNLVPQRYLIGSHGRMRSTITSIDSLEKNYGWRLRQDVLNRFHLGDTHLMDAFQPISIQLITDICDYLARRQFTSQDFFKMGAYSFEGNRHSLVGKIYSQMESFEEAFEAFAKTLMPMFEKNCSYDFQMLDRQTGQVLVKSNDDIASELGVKVLGSPHICDLKAGIWGSLVSYFNRGLPSVTHPKCQHRGDSVCQFVFDFSHSMPLNLQPESASPQAALDLAH